MKRDITLYLSDITENMRDRVIHVYFGVDYTRVWEAVRNVLPSVRPKIESLLAELKSEQSALPGS